MRDIELQYTINLKQKKTDQMSLWWEKQKFWVESLNLYQVQKHLLKHHFLNSYVQIVIFPWE